MANLWFVLAIFFTSFIEFSKSSTIKPGASDNLNSINKLSISFHNAVGNIDENVIFSPLSISIGLVMLLQGACGETRRELMNFLQNGANSTDLNALQHSYKGIIDQYTSKWMRWKLEMANLALISKEYKLKDEYKNNMETVLKAKVLGVGFKSNSTLIVDYVNHFVASNTDGLISKALDGPLDPNTKLLIINTVAFNGEWTRPFSKSMVIQRNFYDKSNQTGPKIPFMTQTVRTNYGEIPEKDMRILELEYIGNVSMYILLPNKNDGLSKLLGNITWQEIESFIEKRLTFEDIDVEVPKFEFKGHYDLSGLLISLELPSIFTNRANFSGIAEPGDIRLTGAVHKAIIKVDEKGTKAASFTGFGFHPLSIMFGQNQFIADHPFLFFIRDKSNGINIFSGAVHRL